MTGGEWLKVLASLTAYFPTLADALTPEQAAEWRRALSGIPVDRVQEAMAKHYRTGDGTWPTLGRIVTLARPLVQPVHRASEPRSDEERSRYAAEVREQCRIGREMLAARRAARQANQQAEANQ